MVMYVWSGLLIGLSIGINSIEAAFLLDEYTDDIEVKGVKCKLLGVWLCDLPVFDWQYLFT
jgi:hypothetical protein